MSPGREAPPAATIEPSLEEVRALAADGAYRRIPVRRELLADGLTTIEALRRARAASSHCFLLESAEPDERCGRYSFLGFSPSVELTCADGLLTITRDVEDPARRRVERRRVEHPGDAIRALLAERRSPRLPGFPPFSGGLVGYFSYDYLKYAEPTLRGEKPVGDEEPARGDGLGRGEVRGRGEETARGEAPTRPDFLDVDLMLFEDVVAFDSYRQRLVLVSSVDADDVNRSYERAARRLDEMQRILESGPRYPFEPLALGGELTARYDRACFCGMVDRAKELIREGEIFQVVLSNPLTASAEGSLLDAYRVLRATNPSPYMVFLTSDDIEVAAASPETLARLEDGRLLTYPLAGTRPRGATPEEDLALERDLLADEKELAEHNMLVDLGRNDVGRVAELGSIRVEGYLDVLRFSHVMHIGSTVSGRLAQGRDAVDVVDSILPAGTLSGAPKIRACQVISELEGRRRGIYGGAIGYLDLSGNLDTCIGIRLAYRRAGEVCVQSGAGIVADSVPEREFEECRNKARAVVDALRQAEGGLA